MCNGCDKIYDGYKYGVIVLVSLPTHVCSVAIYS